MTLNSTRRGFIAGISSGTAMMLLATKMGLAKERIVVVEWGSNYVDAAKAMAAKQDKVDITWVLHSGGAAGIIPKIKAAWPRVEYDLVTGWDAPFSAMINEDWPEVVTVDNVPNLADVPESLIMKDKKNNWRDIPRTLAAVYWGYREDTSPIKLTDLEQLLDSKLKGQICFPDPGWTANYQMLTLAFARGGGEHNMEPGWEFMKELAKSGNIGRIAHSEVEIVNSLSSGETSVAIGNGANWADVRSHFPVKELVKVKGGKGLKTGITTEGWVVLKGGKTRDAFEFANFAMSPENNELLNAGIGGVPTNRKARVADKFKHLVFSSDELKEYGYIPDWGYMLAQADASMKRWEQEIVPLLGR